MDAGGDNALHVAAREGHANAARALLADSEIDAVATNLKGKSDFKHQSIQFLFFLTISEVIPGSNDLKISKNL